PLLLRELNLSELLSYFLLFLCRLKGWDVKHKGCSALMSALNLNPSHLRELNLSKNKLGDSGVKTLSDLLKNTQCKLEKLQLVSFLAMGNYILCECSITEEQGLILTSALKSNPSHLRELDLNENKIKDTGLKILCDVLKDSRCKLERLRLNDCNLTDKSCSALAAVLESDTNLKELNMNNNNLQDSGVKLLCNGLRNITCELEILSLRKCGLTEESCSALATVLRSNSSLKELDMSNNNLQDSGVKKLELEDKNCKLENLR
uniref:Uncharacterized protein n=1 Tax=Sinocyclocheilus grahami TaxID=75366 RepID=A0A672ST48_SINGR